MADNMNDKLAMRRMRVEINRLLVKWDPLGVADLRGGDREYEQYVGPISIMVKKGEDYMAIARHLDKLLTEEWKLPQDKQRCVDVATRIYNVGAVFRGEEPRSLGR